jgi:parallel beta-helix repeat protein
MILPLLFSSPSHAQSTINVPANQPTIQAAINAANNGDTVLVAPGTYTENVNFNGKAITVTSSGGPSTTIIDGGAQGSVVTFGSAETTSSQLSGFTIRNGLQNGLAGGGISITGASPTITGNIITGNHAAIGIGVYVNGGSPVITNNTITGNDQTGAGDGGQGGGGILVSGNSSTPGNPQIVGNTITNNSVAFGGNGGGISITYFSSPLVQANLIEGNTSYNGGGGVSVQSINSPVVVENVIANNSSLGGGSGGGLWVWPGGTTQIFTNNTITSNTAFNNTSGIYVTGTGQNATFTNNIIVAASGQDAVTCNSTYSSISPVFSYNDSYSVSGQAWVGICDSTSHPGNISVDPLFVNSATNFHLQSESPVIDVGNNSAPNLPTTDFDGNTRIWDGNNDCVSTVDLGAYELTNFMAASISPNSFTFPPQLAGTTSALQSATATSFLATCWQFANTLLVGPFIQTNNCPAPGIPAGTSCTFNFAFAPAITDIGMIHGIFVANSIVGTSLYVDLFGTSVPTPVVSLSPPSMVFPPQIVGTMSTPQTVTLSNVGSAALTISSITPTGDFALAKLGHGCGPSLNVGANCTISVSFVPSAYGSRSGAIIISDNAASSPQSVSLGGTGIDFAIVPSPTSAAVLRGNSTNVNVTITPLGGAFGNRVSLSCSGLPSHSSCSFSPSQLSPGSTGAFSVMTLSTDASAPVGNYLLTITGVSGTLSHSSQVQLTVFSKH